MRTVFRFIGGYNMTEFFKNKCLCIILLLNLIILGYFFRYDGYAYMDTFEHLRMSWLVSLGNMPYRDFFEHHHPLLWYTFAPLMKILPHNAMLAFYVAKAVAAVCSLLTFYIFYLIFKRFLGGSNAFWYFLLCSSIFFPILYSFSFFKPESFARFFYVLGLYCFLDYAEVRKTKSLIWCGICFCVAFFFIQTIVFGILPLGLPLIVLCRKNKRCYADAAITALICMVLLGAFAAWLYFNGAWSRYIETNWLLNNFVFTKFYRQQSYAIWFWLPYYLIALVCGIYTWRKQPSFCYNTFFLLFVCSFIQHIYYPPTQPHYLIELSMLTAIVATPLLMSFMKSEKKSFLYAFFLFSAVTNLVSFFADYSKEGLKKMALVNQDENAQIFNVYFTAINVYAPQLSYYVMFNRLHSVDGTLFHSQPDYDVNDFINKHRPQYINIEPEGIYTQYPPRFSLNPKILQNDYQQILPDLYQRKDTFSADE